MSPALLLTFVIIYFLLLLTVAYFTSRNSNNDSFFIGNKRYGAGPRTLAEANGHRADENLKLDDLHKATEVIALALHDLLAAVP